MNKLILALTLLCASLSSYAVKIDDVELGNVLATLQHEDGRTSVISQELCVLREIVVANSATLSVLKDGKLVARGCLVTVGEEKQPYVVFEGVNFALTKYKIDLSKFTKYAPKDVLYF
jgi:hypothetical protein